VDFALTRNPASHFYAQGWLKDFFVNVDGVVMLTALHERGTQYTPYIAGDSLGLYYAH